MEIKELKNDILERLNASEVKLSDWAHQSIVNSVKPEDLESVFLCGFFFLFRNKVINGDIIDKYEEFFNENRIFHNKTIEGRLLFDGYYWGKAESQDIVAVDHSVVNGHGSCKIAIHDYSVARAMDSSRVWASNNSKVYAHGNSKVAARDKSIVFARDNSIVFARDNSIVRAWGKSEVFARGKSTATAWENSMIYADDNSTVHAHKSIVYAWGNSTVYAWGNSTVYRYTPTVTVIIKSETARIIDKFE